MKVIQNPITDHLPLGCPIISTNEKCKLVNINEYAESCFLVSQEINQNGLEIEFEFIYKSVTDIFIDFLDQKNKTLARKNFLVYPETKRILDDLIFSFSISSDVSDKAVQKDMRNYLNQIKEKQSIFNIIMLVFIIFFGIFCFFTIDRVEKYKKLLTLFSNFPKLN